MSKLRTRVYSSLRRLGEYELLRKIGSGGMAEVWMGRRAAMAGASKAVAIKLLARDVLDDPAYRQMFIEEARLSMLLTNSNVVQVFDVGEIDGECFMVMEWVDGLNLSELTNKMLRAGENLSVVVAAHVIGEVLRALAYAHGLHHDGAEATIVHRDVSPHNVLVSISGEVKLADFGVARLAREETSGLHVKGKLRYMAPEQLRGRSREPTVDLYAVGAILHELLAGERFRTTRDEGDLYSLVLSGEYSPLSTEIPPELDELRKRLLEPDPTLRIQSADHALELLCAWPGYRNSSLELARLVREWVGVKAPRSGIISTGLAASVAKQGSAAAVASQALTKPTPKPNKPAKPEGGSALSEAATMVEVGHVESGPQADRGATETRTAMESAPETSATAMITPEAARAPISSLLIVAAVTLAISFGVFGLGFPLGWWGGGGDSVAVRESETAVDSAADSRESSTTGDGQQVDPAEVTAQVQVPADTATVGDTQMTAATSDEVAAETEDGGDETTETGETGDSAETGETGDTAETGETGDPPPPPPPKKLKPAEVEFKTGEFGFVYVQVKGKSLTLQPRAIVKLPEGAHRVRLRLDEADPWTNAGILKLESGKRYEVKMTKPAGFTVRPL